MATPSESSANLVLTSGAAAADESSVPSFHETLTEISELVPPLYRAFEHGTHEARAFFEQRGERPDPFLFPSLVRYFARLFLLSQEGISATEYDLETLSNNGLSLFHNDYHIRVLKGENGQLPVPGKSEPKQKFYAQQASMLPSTTKLNLVVLWDTDSSYNLEALWLACPKSGATTRASVEEHWCERLDHPTEAESTSDGGLTPPTDDLPISRLPESAAKTGTESK